MIKHKEPMMGGMLRIALLATMATVGLWVQASPSGLNNIPTADTCPEQTVVFQTWGGFGGGDDAQNWIGIKYGLLEHARIGNIEIGADWRTVGGPYLDPQFQAKYGLNIGKTLNMDGYWPTLCAGFANMTTDWSRSGEPMPYSVLTYDVMGWCRLHAGYGFQRNNEGTFLGIDRTFKVSGVNLMVCGDAIQCNDGEQALFAPGLKISPSDIALEGVVGTILRHTAVEVWSTYQTSGEAESYVAKLNLIFPF